MLFQANKFMVIGHGSLKYKHTTQMCGKNNYSTGIWEKGGKDIIFRKSFTDMQFELALKDEGRDLNPA